MSEVRDVIITVESQCYRKQFEDWLAGGTVEYKDKTYYWAAEDVRYGWEVEPINEDDWLDMEEYDQIVDFIMQCLCKHESTYVGQVRVR